MDNQRPIATLTKRSQNFQKVAFSERSVNQINAQYENNRAVYKTSQKIDSLIQKAFDLHKLGFFLCFFQSADWIKLGQWEQLQQLQIRSCQIPKKTKIQMKRFPKLQNFKLMHTDLQIDFEGVSLHFKKICMLQIEVKDIDLRQIKNLQELDISLSLSDLSFKRMVEVDLPHLQKLQTNCYILKSFRYLSFGKWKSLKSLKVHFLQVFHQSENNIFIYMAYSQFPQLEQLVLDLKCCQNVKEIQQIQKYKYNLKTLQLAIIRKHYKNRLQEEKLKERFNEAVKCTNPYSPFSLFF